VFFFIFGGRTHAQTDRQTDTRPDGHGTDNSTWAALTYSAMHKQEGTSGHFAAANSWIVQQPCILQFVMPQTSRFCSLICGNWAGSYI